MANRIKIKEYSSPSAEVELSPATFKGQLEQFAYSSATTTASTAPTASLTPNTNDSSSKSSRKRKAEDSKDQPSMKRITRSSSRSPMLPAQSTPKIMPSTSSSLHSALTPTKSPTPSRRTSAKTCPSKYASVPNLLVDSIPSNLILLLIGLNPGLTTARTGNVYAHPSNLYWKLLHSSGITPIRHPPSDTYRLPELYSIGNTNIVTRPTKDGSEVSKQEMDEGVSVLEEKIGKNKPEAVCIVGKSVWESIWRVKKGKSLKKEEFRYGWQDEDLNMGRGKAGEQAWKGAPVFVATTTSGLAAGMRPPEKEAIWKVLGGWVVKRREERKLAAGA